MSNTTNFFKETTIRICGSLDIEKALHRCLLFLKKHIPAEEAAFLYYDSEPGTITLFAHANSSGGQFVNLNISYSDQTRSLLKSETLTAAYIDNRAEDNPMAQPILMAMGKDRSSIIVVRLILEQVWIGSFVLYAEGWDRFSKEHMELLKQLKQPFAIALSNSRRYKELLYLKEILTDDNRYLHHELQQIRGDEIIGADFGLKTVMQMVRQVAPLDSPVLLLGETGTGKEVIASAIHNMSLRKNGPFIKVNCGAIPPSLMDSELFGHEKGAFTGALSKKRGRFERAHNGTIFLDEVGELSQEAQVRLLRVLQDKEIEPVGATKNVKLNIRVIAATHRDLESMISRGLFRQDLYFRLQVFPITIPPLRNRPGDIPALAHYFISKKSHDAKLSQAPTMAPGATRQLLNHKWPGNIRELENTIERAIILSNGHPIVFPDLDSHPPKNIEQPGVTETTPILLDQVIADHIRKILIITSGRIEGKSGAAELLGVKPSTLRHRMRKLSIPFGKKSAIKNNYIN